MSLLLALWAVVSLLAVPAGAEPVPASPPPSPRVRLDAMAEVSAEAQALAVRLAAKAAQLVNREAALRAREAGMTAREAAVAAAVARATPEAERVVLNVGGTRFDVGARTLSAAGAGLRNLPAAAAQEGSAQQPVPFIDRDPETFALVLDWLRYGVLPDWAAASDDGGGNAPMMMMQRKKLQHDAAFFNITGLLRALQNNGTDGSSGGDGGGGDGGDGYDDHAVGEGGAVGDDGALAPLTFGSGSGHSLAQVEQSDFERLAEDNAALQAEQARAPPPDALAEADALAVLLETSAPRKLCKEALGEKTWLDLKDKWREWSGPSRAIALGAEVLRVVDLLGAPHLLPTAMRPQLAPPLGADGVAPTGNKPTCFGLKNLLFHMERP